MPFFIFLGGLIGAFIHLILRDGIRKEGNITNWKNWLIAFLLSFAVYAVYSILTLVDFLPLALNSLTKFGLGIFLGFSLDDLSRKFYDKRPSKR